MSFICLVIGITSVVFVKSNVTDAQRFKKEYANVRDDNVFIYKSTEEIINILEHGTGIVYLGFPECPWCQAYVKFLDEVD